jgi:hypothetical protein
LTNVVLTTRELATLEEHLLRCVGDALALFRADHLLQGAVAFSVLIVVREALTSR